MGDGLGQLHQANRQPPANPAPCKKKHWVQVKLRHQDDNTSVPATKCIIHKGSTTVNAGPLASGALKSSDVTPGSYEVSFPDIHADEWRAG